MLPRLPGLSAHFPPQSALWAPVGPARQGPLSPSAQLLSSLDSSSYPQSL